VDHIIFKKIMGIERAILSVIRWTLFIIMGGMTLVVLLGICFRYVLKAPLPWSEEMARYLMVWGASLGAAVAFWEGSHVAITAVVDRFRGFYKKVFKWLAQIIIVLFMAVVTYKGFLLTFDLWTQASPAMEIAMTWPYLAIPVGSFLVVFHGLILVLFPADWFHEKKKLG
jgi:TRAP-type C4-dicarboxylate transport system permease small subunit